MTRLLFPPRCLFCRELLPSEGHRVCVRCEEDLPRTAEGSLFALEEIVCAAPFFYEDMVRSLVNRYKFRGKHGHCVPMSAYIAQAAGHLPPADLVTWTPVSRARLRSRGYDQSKLLARETGARLALPVAETLRKVRDTPTQNRMGDKDARTQNVAGAFQALPEAARGRRVLLVDDVCTSGATLEECARTLRDAGADEVACAVFARSRHSGLL